MPVCVDQAWQHGSAAQVDRAYTALRESADLGVRADRADSVAGQSQRLDPRAPGMERVDIAVDQNLIRRRRRAS